MGAGEELGSLMVTGEGPGIPTESSEEPNGLTDMAEEVCGMMANVEELDCPRFAGEVPGNVTDTSDDPANATDNGGIPGNVTDTGGIPGNVTDTGEVPGNAMVTGEVPGNAKDTVEVPGNAMDTDNPGNATDISDDPGNAMETGEAPGSPTDTAEEPKSPTEMGKETVEPMDNNERSSDLDGSGKIACGFDSILEMVSGPAGRNGTSAVMGKRAGAPGTGMDCGTAGSGDAQCCGVVRRAMSGSPAGMVETSWGFMDTGKTGCGHGNSGSMASSSLFDGGLLCGATGNGVPPLGPARSRGISRDPAVGTRAPCGPMGCTTVFWSCAVNGEQSCSPARSTGSFCECRWS